MKAQERYAQITDGFWGGCFENLPHEGALNRFQVKGVGFRSLTYPCNPFPHYPSFTSSSRARMP